MNKNHLIICVLFIMNLIPLHAQNRYLKKDKSAQIQLKMNTRIDVMTVDRKQKDHFFLERIEIAYVSYENTQGTKPTIALVMKGKTTGNGAIKNCTILSDEIPIVQTIYHQIMNLKQARVQFRIECKGHRMDTLATRVYLKSFSPMSSTFVIIHNY